MHIRLNFFADVLLFSYFNRAFVFKALNKILKLHFAPINYTLILKEKNITKTTFLCEKWKELKY